MFMAENVQCTALCSILTNYEAKMSEFHHGLLFLCNFVLSANLSVHLKHEGRENSLYFVLQNLIENATPFKFQKITFAPVGCS